ncbi:MAG: enoyl-CoA hydratase/isomerase family protein [Acidimicrobiales bacterium]|jgi:enoyl-CoA hydratase|nr:enoyl-CoA hydratase/isomerase family protein [Acidimicrobiales bacterium]
MTEIALPTDKMLARVEDGIGWMTYNNPARLNAMSMAMQQSVPIILEAFQNDPEVRVVVVHGAGGKAFVSGADISEFGEKRTSPEARALYDEAAANAGRAWAGVDKPIIGMIDGYCIGGGMLTALSTDIRICSEGSQFGVPAARLGLGYGYAGVEKLQALVGPAWTAEILFSARRLSSEEALRIGLVNRVVAKEELEMVVRELAAQIAVNAPLTVKACKAALRETQKDPAKRDMDRVAGLVEACFRSEDYLEGQQAFLEKRAPQFRGV